MYDTYVSIDLETTGLNPKRDRIIEIGAIRVEQLSKPEIGNLVKIVDELVAERHLDR